MRRTYRPLAAHNVAGVRQHIDHGRVAGAAAPMPGEKKKPVRAKTLCRFFIENSETEFPSIPLHDFHV